MSSGAWNIRTTKMQTAMSTSQITIETPPSSSMEWSESETDRISLSICRMTFATRFSLWIRPARRSTTKKIAIPTSGTTIRA